MRLICCHKGQLQDVESGFTPGGRQRTFHSGLAELDELLPRGAFAYGAIHEILSPPGQPAGLSLAAILARAAAMDGLIAWCDPQRQLYPPALAARGFDLRRLLLLRPGEVEEAMWATTECLRCPAISATVTSIGRLSRLEARRLQLAAEHGSGVGLVLRPYNANASIYSAATRWLVQTMPGQRHWQRWQVQLIHGHGGRVGQSVILEVSRETDHVRVLETVGDRSVAAARA